MPKRNYTSTAGEKTIANVGGISNSATEITLDSLTNLPASYPYTLVIDPDVTNKEEIVLVTSAGSTANSLTIVRGSTPYTGSASFVGNYNGGDGTAAVAHDFGAKVKHMITARDLQEPQTHIFSSQDVHGLTGTGNQGGDVVGTNKTQTLTNKTISSANNTLTIQSSDVSGLSTLLDAKANLAAPTFTGNVVLPSTTTIGSVDSTELGYLNGVTSAIQTQLDNKQGLDADLTAVAGLSTTGIVVRTGAGTAATRTLVAGTNITLTNADGVSGNITINASGGASGVSSIAGTTNQITASASTGAVTLSLPSTLTLPSTTVATTQTSTDNSTKVATTAFVQTAVTQNYAALYTNATLNPTGDSTIAYNAEHFDTFGAHSTTTNNDQYKPTTAGKFMLTAHISIKGGGGTGLHTAYFRKNGTKVAGSDGTFSTSATGQSGTISISSMVSLNGSTDYVDVYLDIPSISGASVEVTSTFNIQYLGA